MAIGTVGRKPWERTHCTRCGLPAEKLTTARPVCARCIRDIRLIDHYGLTADEVDAMIPADGLCPICRRVTTKWVVDHDHGCCPGKKSCGSCVRGVLCDDCNLGIGLFHDDVEALRRAITYLDCGPSVGVIP